MIRSVKDLVSNLTGANELSQLLAENNELRAKDARSIAYIRSKVNQLLMVMGTLPLRQEELDDATLLELDPIGIVSDSFTQVLEHLNETNDKLRLANDEIQTILAVAGVGILVVDSQMRIQAYNLKMRELFPRTDVDVMGQTCCRVLCGLDAPPKYCTFEMIMTRHINVHLSDWVFKDRHFDVTGAPIKNRFGEITHVVLVYNDITDRKRTEESLRGNEEMYMSLFENAMDLIQSVLPDGTFNFVNRTWRETLGYESDEIAGLTLRDIIHPDSFDHCMEVFRQLQTGHTTARVATVFVTKGGKPLRVEGNISCILSDGQPAVTCGIFRTIDEMKGKVYSLREVVAQR